MAETIRKHHPDWVLWLCLSDQEPEGFEFDLDSEEFDHVVRVWELDVPGHHSWVFGHDVVELCTAVKGPMLQRILASGAERVLYIDPDIALFAPLVHVEELLETKAVVLTPHLLSPERTRSGVVDNEISCLKHGVYNLGFVAVRNCPDGNNFANWWADRLREFCHDDIPNGLFTDQRWCDLAPALFDNVSVLRDPGYNVASWNIDNRPISISDGGEIFAGDALLRFFHFTKVNSVGEAQLDRYSRGRPEVFELLRWYRSRLIHHASKSLPAGWWRYSHYDDGMIISRPHRICWRQRPDLHEKFADPFSVGPDTFRSWYESNVR
ncbi:hypothetical protein QTI51_28810 [Variovorax sp. J22G73]|uniref:hypothetical protein n=1 Tax=unclassified Variovorax TaxID=663243 RepID=UPI0025781B04|nr:MULTISPECIES: hypothetical protein [unclassified Variovorax]MDM0008852.1 hypothetical protein [Variovorax sp. J22R203]MDM0101312.1 hypothetical protein [Variovorax sp. J22G73]